MLLIEKNMQNNPFTKNNFESVWLKHFKQESKPIQFKSIDYAKFYKAGKLPFYENVGKNITNGMFYRLNEGETDYKGKTFFIHDVPEYFNIKTDIPNTLKVKKVRQYKGFSADLNGFKTFDDYFNFIYSSKSRYKFRNRMKRLETCFDVYSKVFCGDISKEEYDLIFEYMIDFIKTRFDSLGLTSNIVSKKDYYYELGYQMILKKEAYLFVLYADNVPIGISFGFLSDEILFYAITTFNIDFIKFNIGHLIIIKLMDWCFQNNIKILDFSKGQYEYKDRWSNTIYYFNCHILYDSKSLKSIVIANMLKGFYGFKQFLREKRVNFMYSKLKYMISGSKKEENLNLYQQEVLKNDFNENEYNLKEVEENSKEYTFLKSSVIDYLYGKPERFNEIKFYRDNDQSDTYFAIGKSVKLKVFK